MPFRGSSVLCVLRRGSPFLPSLAGTPACIPTDLRHSRLSSSSHRSPDVLHLLDPPPLSLFVGECKVSDTRFLTPHAAWSLPHFQLVSLASVSIATVQASIPQSAGGGVTAYASGPLHGCLIPFHSSKAPTPFACAAEQTLTSHVSAS